MIVSSRTGVCTRFARGQRQVRSRTLCERRKGLLPGDFCSAADRQLMADCSLSPHESNGLEAEPYIDLKPSQRGSGRRIEALGALGDSRLGILQLL